jgi:hypothetical protein
MARTSNIANKERLAAVLCAIIVLSGVIAALLWWVGSLARAD